ncbi:22.7 kDa class IV heat shock protein-like [Neltuma alba]|uniref:22.7 kDa class IV heat shock protein-like n=1 Tax=Neltuma alba TaxID=207710 RepID=UPI0010A43A89|nr:22.7 kDa class IV heat shock protein-like [Prosopis alba]XP_028804057.1 22.7 kDa class IV heat shock protein-like [Prosopis alba]
MASKIPISTFFLIIASMFLLFHTGEALIPYTRSLWDTMFPSDDPFRILEQSPLNIPRNLETPLALARADWKETPTEHVIAVDIPGMKKEDVKIEVEENRVVRISGERKEEGEVEGEKWHRAERTNGKFWRQFRMPGNADLDQIRARIEDGVLRIVVPKHKEETKRQPKVINIAEDQAASGEDVKATKASA